MSPAFLYPLALLGALAVGIPLWLHLHRRFQGTVVRFSAMRFLEDEPLARRAPLRLKNPLLFALRALAVLLLAAAFAWPYDRSEVIVPSLESRVYLIDNTMSHQADAAFEKERDALADELRAASTETQVAVVELASQPRIVAPFDQNHVAAAEAVRGLQPTYERGSYAAAFRLADTLLRSSVGDRRRLIVYSDDQANQFEELKNSPPFLENVEVEWAKCNLDARSNVALARPQLRRLLAGDRSLLELSLEVYHQGDVPSASLQVISNGKRVFERTIDLKGTPERVVLNVRWDEERGVAVRGEAVVEARPDTLASDNRVYFTLPQVRRGRVALAARSIFLKAAFGPDVMQQAWNAQTIDPANLNSAPNNVPADVLCIESHFIHESAAATKLLREYLDADRGVFLVIDDASSEVVQTLKEIGFDLADKAADATEPKPLGYLQRNHPIFEPFRSPDFGNLTGVHISRYFPVQSKTATPLMFTDSGDPLLFESGNQKLLVATFPMERGATDWPLQPTFVPFLDLCLQRLRGEDVAPTNLLPRETAVFHLPTGSKARRFTLSDGKKVLERGEVQNRRVQVTSPAKPGIYELSFDNTADETMMLAVNPPPLESELRYAEPDKVTSSIVLSDEATQKAANQTAARDLTSDEILQQRLWWVILMVCLAAVFGENIWLALRGRAGI